MFSIIIPTYRSPKMTAYSLAQILKYSKLGDVQIVIVNNYPDDTETKKRVDKVIESVFGSSQYVSYIDYPKDRMQTPGVAVDWAIENGLLLGSYFMYFESDSYPMDDNWVPYYLKIIDEDYDAALSMLKLSGGLYGHPCGGLFKMSAWEECNEYLKTVQYSYFPNFNKRQGFDYHLMVHDSVLDKVLDNPEDFFDTAEGYKPYSKEKAIEKRDFYKPTVGVFHNGMGNLEEEVLNYGKRGFETGMIDSIFDNKRKIIRRVGLEPGQYFSYWLFANNKKVASIPTEVVWMDGRINQQQEYTLNEAEIKHIWGVSSYTERPAEGVEDIFKEKRELPEKLYSSLPENQKI